MSKPDIGPLKIINMFYKSESKRLRLISEGEYHRENLSIIRRHKRFETERIRSIYETEKALIKATMIINGGASLAVLALIGSIWSPEESKVILSSLTFSLVYLSSGVLGGAVALFSGYLLTISDYATCVECESTGTYYNEVIHDLWIIKIKSWKASVLLYLMIVLTLFGSIVLFALGVNEATSALFEHYLTEPHVQEIHYH